MAGAGKGNCTCEWRHRRDKRKIRWTTGLHYGCIDVFVCLCLFVRACVCVLACVRVVCMRRVSPRCRDAPTPRSSVWSYIQPRNYSVYIITQLSKRTLKYLIYCIVVVNLFTSIVFHHWSIFLNLGSNVDTQSEILHVVSNIYVLACMCVCMYVCMYVCM